MNSNFEEEIKSLIYKVRGQPRKPITPDTRLRSDLLIDGDDGLELMEMIFDNFNIDSDDFSISRYFYPEGLSLFGIPKLVDIISRRKSIPPPTSDITVKMLLEAASAGKWLDKVATEEL